MAHGSAITGTEVQIENKFLRVQVDITLKPQPSVYCTWYHARASNEKRLLENRAFVRQQLKPFGLSVMQIDDQWQAKFPPKNSFSDREKTFQGIGPVKVFCAANDNFPRGMSYTAAKLKTTGLVPGLWFMPFAGTWNNPTFADKQDLFESEIPRIWLLADQRNDSCRYVIGLFNWQEKEPVTILYDMERLGLKADTTYVAFDYWADRLR